MSEITSMAGLRARWGAKETAVKDVVGFMASKAWRPSIPTEFGNEGLFKFPVKGHISCPIRKDSRSKHGGNSRFGGYETEPNRQCDFGRLII
jgi:hypothetical protein